MHGYVRPCSLEEALVCLGDGPRSILAGGTDLYPAAASREAWGGASLGHPSAPPVLDVSGLDELREIQARDDHYELGALVTWADVCESGLPSGFNVLRLAAREIGGKQIQNRGTVSGNLCNASPAADGVPALIALDASVRLASQRGIRELALEQFVLGNRKTALAPDEMMTAIVVPRPPEGARSTFLKLGARRYLVISIAMVAACIELADDHVRRARIVVGACSEVAVRLRALEARLSGVHRIGANELVVAEDFEALRPQDDARAQAWYRKDSAQTLVRRALTALCAP